MHVIGDSKFFKFLASKPLGMKKIPRLVLLVSIQDGTWGTVHTPTLYGDPNGE